MIRALFIAPHLTVSGADISILTLAAHLDRRRVVPIGLHVWKDWIHDAMRERAEAAGLPLLSAEQISELPPGERPDVVVSYATRLSNPDCPTVVVSRASHRNLRHCAGLAINCEEATHFVGISQTAAEAFPSLVRHRVKIIHSGGDPRRLRATKSSDMIRRDWQRLCGVPVGNKVAIQCGRLAHEKGVESLARAAAHLPDDWSVGLVGDVRNAELIGTLKEIAADLPVGKLFALPGDPQVGNFLAGASVACLFSRWEGLGNAAIEAWLAGVPLAAAPLDSIAEMERLADCTLATKTFPDPSPAEIAEAIQKAHTFNGRAAAAKAISFSHGYLTASHMARRWEDYLESIVPPRAAEAACAEEAAA